MVVALVWRVHDTQLPTNNALHFFCLRPDDWSSFGLSQIYIFRQTTAGRTHLVPLWRLSRNDAGCKRLLTPTRASSSEWSTASRPACKARHPPNGWLCPAVLPCLAGHISFSLCGEGASANPAVGVPASPFTQMLYYFCVRVSELARVIYFRAFQNRVFIFATRAELFRPRRAPVLREALLTSLLRQQSAFPTPRIDCIIIADTSVPAFLCHCSRFRRCTSSLSLWFSLSWPLRRYSPVVDFFGRRRELSATAPFVDRAWRVRTPSCASGKGFGRLFLFSKKRKRKILGSSKTVRNLGKKLFGLSSCERRVFHNDL